LRIVGTSLPCTPRCCTNIGMVAGADSVTCASSYWVNTLKVSHRPK